MKPLGYKVLVEVDPEYEVTGGGIYLPAKVKKFTGTVLKVGSRVKYVKPGDRVLFHNNCGMPVYYQGKECIFLTLSENKSEIISIL